MKLIGKAVIASLVVAATSVVACSSNHGTTSRTGSNTPATGIPGSSAPTDGQGAVGIQYTLQNGGGHITSVSYKLTDGTNTYTGTVNVGGSSVISFVIPGVAAGTGYNIRLDAQTDDGKDTCTGTVGGANPNADPPGSVVGTTFTVTNRSTTNVNVNLICLDNINQAQGSVGLNALTSCCATWDTAVADPVMPITTNPTFQLIANASAPCGNTGGGTNSILSCVWTVTTGSANVGPTAGDGFGNFHALLTCSEIQDADIVTLTCTDGPLPDGGSCPAWSTTTSVTVNCGHPPPCSQAGESGVIASPDSASGHMHGQGLEGLPLREQRHPGQQQ